MPVITSDEAAPPYSPLPSGTKTQIPLKAVLRSVAERAHAAAVASVQEGLFCFIDFCCVLVCVAFVCGRNSAFCFCYYFLFEATQGLNYNSSVSLEDAAYAVFRDSKRSISWGIDRVDVNGFCAFTILITTMKT